ncbi:MAG: glycosyltransferase family 4 protein [Alphaproteobacteria bacterium]|nr:glycosyltransferase family 4 protein [Alphaproteobacteria bacterium]
MKRGLVFSKYDTLAAATRQRMVQAMPYLAQEGIELQLAPLFDNAYLGGFFAQGKRPIAAIASAYAKRLMMLTRMGAYDFIWVQYELFPYLPLEWLIRLTNKPVILDYDDAIFHQYDQHPNPLVRAALGRKLQGLMRRANMAFCGNNYLREYVARYCNRAEIIPTVVDVAHYTPPISKDANVLPTLGWIGSPSTWRYCQTILPVLSSLVHAKQMHVLVVGANHAADTSLPFEYRLWYEAREISDIHAMDIGIMPIPDAPWARGKCGYKLIQYMACGIPVIASPVGVNSEIVQHGVNGLLASTPEEWQAAINQLVGDAALRQRLGQAGRKTVEERYSIQRYGPEIARLIHEVC